MIASQDRTTGGGVHGGAAEDTETPPVTVRAYVPCTLELLRELRDRGGFGPAPVAAHAVTPALEALGPGSGEEELEWAASVSASLDSLRLLARERAQDQPRRVVAAVDVASVQQAGDGAGGASVEGPPSAVVLSEVPLRRLAALLVDAPGAEPLVGAARDALAGGAAEDDPAVERCLDEELGWWAASELDVLLDG
jgi:hypothetical protein